MKRFTTITLSLALALTLTLTLAACGGGDTPTGSNGAQSGDSTPTETPTPTPTPEATPDNGGNLEVGNINAGNWAEVIQEHWSFDISLPSDWSIKSATGSTNIGSTEVRIVFNVGGSETAEQFGNTIFDISKTLSTKEITHGDGYADTFADTKNYDGSYSWTYYQPLPILPDGLESTNSGGVVIKYYDNGDTVALEFIEYA